MQKCNIQLVVEVFQEDEEISRISEVHKLFNCESCSFLEVDWH